MYKWHTGKVGLRTLRWDPGPLDGTLKWDPKVRARRTVFIHENKLQIYFVNSTFVNRAILNISKRKGK